MNQTVTCPTCKGTGASQGIVCSRIPGQSRAGVIPCSDCKGAGRVAAEVAELNELGQQLRDAIDEIGITIGRARNNLGMERREFSDLMFGRGEKAATLAAIEAVRKMEPITEAEAAASQARIDAISAAVASGVSPCCQAEINDSAVIKNGRHKGHGRRYCRACGNEVYRV